MFISLATPTVSEVAQRAREVLGDTRHRGGKLYSDNVLLGPIQSAVETLFTLLANIDDFRIYRYAYPHFPAGYTNIHLPSFIRDIAYPVAISFRTEFTPFVIMGASPSNDDLNVQIPSTVHSALPADSSTLFPVTLHDLAGMPGANGIYQARINGPDTILVLGANNGGEWDTAAIPQYRNQLTVGNMGFARLLYNGQQENSLGLPTRPFLSSTLLPFYPSSTAVWANSYGPDGLRIQLPFSNIPFQLEVLYAATTRVLFPNDIIGVPDSLNFLGHLAAANATITRAPNISQSIQRIVWGAGRYGSAEDGLARSLALSCIKRQNTLPQWQRTRPEFGE